MSGMALAGVVAELKQLITLQQEKPSPEIESQLRQAVDVIVEQTNIAYDRVATQYRDIRKSEPHETDKHLFDRLLDLSLKLSDRNTLANPFGTIALLDIGTGPGRDLQYFRRFTYVRSVGIENSSSFISILSDLSKEGLINPGSFHKMDMRDLSYFDDQTFDIVRHNATLLHMPLVYWGIGADQAVEESRRVLVNNGLLFVNVKVGDGMEFVDTQEGLGGRFFQYYTEDTMGELLRRHSFRIVDRYGWREERPSGVVKWLALYAQKQAL